MAEISTPTSNNSAAQTGDSIVSGVVGIGINAGEALLFAEFPFLAVPIVKPLVQLAINFISGYVVKGLSQVVTFAIIDVQTEAEETAFNKALSALKAAQASGDAEAQAAALKDFQIAAQNLSHSDGSASL